MTVLILGRKNVGKSSLFNRITKSRKALVIDEEGITRDVLKERVEWWGESFWILDSGGYSQEQRKTTLDREVEKKVNEALQVADAIVLVTDGRTGLHPEDQSLAEKIRKTGKPWFLSVNKIDKISNSKLNTLDFFQIHDNPFPTSFEKDYGIDGIVEWVIEQKKRKPKKARSVPKLPATLFVVGKSNSG